MLFNPFVRRTRPGAKIRNTLFLFPGAHKTGSSLLQAALFHNRREVRAQNIVIASRPHFTATGLRRQITHLPYDPKFRLDRKTIKRVFGMPIKDKNVLISSEYLFGEIRNKPYSRCRDVMERIVEYFPDHDVKVVFYVRRQDTFLESAYVQSVHRGSTQDFAEYFATFRKFTLDWAQILHDIREVVGRDNASVIPFESIKDGSEHYLRRFFSRFCSISPQIEETFRNDFGDTNVSLSQLGIDAAQAAFAHIPEMRERRELSALMRTRFGIDRYPKFQMPIEVRRRIARAHYEINRRLIDENDLPRKHHAYYLFEDIV